MVSEEERNAKAQAMFGKNFDQCEPHERVKVGAHLGGGRIHEMAEGRQGGGATGETMSAATTQESGGRATETGQGEQ